MKKLLFIALNLFFIFAVKAQDGSKTKPAEEKTAASDALELPDNSVYNSAGLQVQPSFPGGPKEFMKFIDSKFDKTKLEQGATGNLKIYVSFVVETDGSLTNIKVIRDPGFAAGAEVIRVLKLSPKWSPGTQNGKKVRTFYTHPVTVQL